MTILKLILLFVAASAFTCLTAASTPLQSTGEADGGVVDQSFGAPQSAGANINEGYTFVAQTYTAGMTGKLLGVNIDVRSKRGLNPEAGFAMYSLHVSIREVVAQVPGATLGEVTLAADEAPFTMLIKFPQKIAQVKGRQYAIVVNYADAPPSGAGQWLGVWAGGAGSIKGERLAGPDGKKWPSSRHDGITLRFRTYVAPRTSPARPARRRG
jgi:hypothetical protein